ncbi:hypothetical protein V6Z05_00355 [Leptospira venezuelensis]|uniref:hypothetical protein n=1 Tax=Leptospira venezuelensis TaxID=1958811 RepID=UPI0012FFCC7E|nr:hypothetical protein [Leptospira venezuelensis]
MGVYVPTSIAVLTSIGATLDLALGLNTFFLSGVGVLEVALPVIGAIGIALLSVLEICKSTGWAGWSSGGMFGGTTGGGMGPSSGG